MIETEQVIQLVGKRSFARFACTEAGGSGDVRDAMGALKCRVERDVAVVSLDGLLTGVLERRGGGAFRRPAARERRAKLQLRARREDARVSVFAEQASQSGVRRRAGCRAEYRFRVWRQ